MQLIAKFRISGVSKVIVGKGKGTTVAQPGDLFVPHDDESGAALLRDGNATKPGAVDVRADTGVERPAETVAETLGTNTLLNVPAAAAKPAKAKAGKKAAAVAAPADSLDDLGLGEDDGQDEVIE